MADAAAAIPDTRDALGPRIFISVAEQSADEHAAGLIEAFQLLRPGASFEGLAGPAMRAVGCGCLEDWTTRSAMAMAAVRRVPAAFKLLRRLKAFLTAEHFDAAVMVDSPALNLPIAKACRKAGIPVLYFIAPQTWAWGPRKWRNNRVRQRVDRLACLWPFEQPYFRAAGIDATYVGHPSFDRLGTITVDEARLAELRGGAAHVITLLPGSRRHVVDEVLPGQLEVVRSLAKRFPRSRFLLVAANEAIQTRVAFHLGASGTRGNVQVLSGAADRAAAILAADLALVASGTITLEVAYHATPMIVMYNASRWSYQLIGRWLITAKHLSIPNLLAGREIVPEFMPYYRTTDPIVARAVEWLSTPGALQRVREDLTRTIQPMVKRGAAANTAKLLASMLDGTAPV